MSFTIRYTLHTAPGKEQTLAAADQADVEAKVSQMSADLSHASVVDDAGRPVAEWRAGRPGLFAVEGTESWVSKG